MGHKAGLSASDKSCITSQLAEGKSTLEISKTIVFDVQLSIWRLRSCSTDGVKNALLISHFIKFSQFRLVDDGHNSDNLG